MRAILLALSIATVTACAAEPAQRSADPAAAANTGAAPARAAATSPAASSAAGEDTAFAALQERGKQAMGVDQYTSTHLFDSLEDGGRIELQRDVDDPEGVAVIRRHMQDIAAAFARGDFRIPGFVHAQEVPGTRVMAERRAHITYTYRELPRGGEVRITTRDPAAIAAIHEFLAFQRMDHRAGGHVHGH